MWLCLQANYHNPGSDHCPSPHFAGALAIAVQGLRAESSDCLNCARVETERVCVAVATGVAPRANSSLTGFTIGLNVGDFADL